MPGLPFVLADKDRIEQFALLARTRGLFRDFDVWNDNQGMTWARRHIGKHCFAVSLLGPGWVFDDYARQARAETLAGAGPPWSKPTPQNAGCNWRKSLPACIWGRSRSACSGPSISGYCRPSSRS